MNLKEKLKWNGKILAKAGLVAFIVGSLLFGIDYCARQYENSNKTNKKYSYQNYFINPKYNAKLNKIQEEEQQLIKTNQKTFQESKERTEYEFEMSKLRVQHELDEIKTQELELRNKRSY